MFRGMRAFIGKVKPAKLFAKHIKVEEQVFIVCSRMIQSIRMYATVTALYRLMEYDNYVSWFIERKIRITRPIIYCRR